MATTLGATHASSIAVRVLVATTGVTYKILLHPSELTVANIRGHLAATVAPQDQILLLGPPYKVPKDSTLRSDDVLNALRLGDMEDNPIQEETETSGEKDKTKIATKTNRLLTSANTERSGARRLFLFSKLALSEQAPDPTPCHLEPMTLQLPTEAPGPSPLNLTQQPQQPLHQALAAYERQFMLYLAQGRVLADGADLRLAAMRQCVQEQAVLCRALRAAVSNLSDHFGAATRTRAEFSVTFTTKTAQHSTLLQRFESSILNGLADVPLHPALINIARASGRTMTTLLDTVPVDREKAWAQQCNTSHQRLVTLFRELDTAFGELGTTADRQTEARHDLEAETAVEALWSEVEGVAAQACVAQAQRLEQLTTGHRDVVAVITNALSADVNELQNAFTPLQEMSSSTKDLIPNMLEDDGKLKELMERVAAAKTTAMKRMKVRLREVSVSQSSIQRVLASVGVLRDALTQQTENMVHLEHVAELPCSYRHFLSELQRRRAYGTAVTSSSVAMMERLAAMRVDEVRAREKFLRGPGRHLMPAFFDTFVPTLATPPPLFTPQLPAMVELDTLPDVSDVVEATAPATGTATDAEGSPSLSLMQQSAVAPPSAGLGSTSTLTVSAGESQGQQLMGSGEEKHQQDQLIVSADEASSSNNLIVDPGADVTTAAAADAEVKTLVYENATLRQALEQLGGKPPRSYIEESEMKSRKSNVVVDDAEIAALKKELVETKLQLQEAKDAQQDAKTSALSSSKQTSRVCDKISHSNFETGDVGLFMPTGRGSGGKRTYLAFHTNCPHRYLSTDCVKGSPDFVLGRIVYQEELVAGEIGTDANPYGLHVGTPFWVLTVEVLNHPPGK